MYQALGGKSSTPCHLILTKPCKVGVIISTEEKEINAQRGSENFSLFYTAYNLAKLLYKCGFQNTFAQKILIPFLTVLLLKKQQVRALQFWIIKLDLLNFFIRTLFPSVGAPVLRYPGGPLGGSSSLNPASHLQVLTIGLLSLQRVSTSTKNWIYNTFFFFYFPRYPESNVLKYLLKIV